jgi:hypothetical protein
LKGVVVDDEQAEFTGDWASGSAGPSVGSGYRHDRNVRDGRSVAVFKTTLPVAGRYEVRLAYAQNANRSTRVPVRVTHAGGEAERIVNQRVKPSIEELFVSLGVFAFSPDKPAVVTISNAGADGYVIADAVQWLPVQ